MISLVLLVVVVVLTTTLYTVGRYFHDSKKLRRFPSPSFAAFSPLWLMYHSWRARQYKAVQAAHEKYGPVVRISPNHVSFTAPGAYKDIYGFGNSIIKDDMYFHMSGGNPSMATATDKHMHAEKRRSLAHVFSAKEITAMEPRVQEMVAKLLRDIHIKSAGGKVSDLDPYETYPDGTFDIRPWLNMLTYDAISAMFFSNTYGMLDKGVDLCPSRSASGATKWVHGMDSFHSGGAFNTLFSHLPLAWNNVGRRIFRFAHGASALSNFAGMSRHQVHTRLRAQPAEPDLFSRLPTAPTEKRAVPMSFDELVAECATMLDAGNDTTQTALTNCIYHLAAHPIVQTKLRNILLEEVPPTSQPIASYQELKHIAYLRAVLDESFRCRPPVARGLPRRTTAAGAVIAGHCIPAGVTISAPIWNVHHNAELFPEPDSFVPERWMPNDNSNSNSVPPTSTSSSTNYAYRAPDPSDNYTYYTTPQEAHNLKTHVLPFHLGPRACIGRNLAYMELSIVIAALLLGFEWELAGGRGGGEGHTPALETVERFNCNVKELFVKVKGREGMVF
ncbi:cytochrome P450 [Lophiotrema nucula]|uniref:Cytochrome P450 n=1 Tax=Lophiotrema nucula TaxID=690887 RepID=A0A6A5ZW04_9PLEO|nr:cytochrome P450 [Lophiotrema nucula]